MFKYLYRLFLSKNPDKLWIKIMVVFSTIVLIFILYKLFSKDGRGKEGFSQNEKFVLKRDMDAYDQFYVKIYDTLTLPGPRVNSEIDSIVDMTQASDKSVFLDVGSGTGHLVDKLRQRGFRSYGIDKSQAMIDQSKTIFPKANVKCCDATDSLSFERATFSHILCMNQTIYQFSDKVAFFRNCFFWLMPGGYLVLHLVDRNRFDPIVSAGKPKWFSSPQQYSDKRITDTIIDFGDFKYKAEYDFSGSNVAVFTETFTDTASSNVRQNEMTLYMDDIDDILKAALFSGFMVKGKSDMRDSAGVRDEHQYLYILER